MCIFVSSFAAHLHSGELVAVKVQRPGMSHLLTLDALLFNLIGGQLKRFAKARKDLLVAVNEMVSFLVMIINFLFLGQITRYKYIIAFVDVTEFVLHFPLLSYLSLLFIVRTKSGYHILSSGMGLLLGFQNPKHDEVVELCQWIGKTYV